MLQDGAWLRHADHVNAGVRGNATPVVPITITKQKWYYSKRFKIPFGVQPSGCPHFETMAKHKPCASLLPALVYFRIIRLAKRRRDERRPETNYQTEGDAPDAPIIRIHNADTLANPDCLGNEKWQNFDKNRPPEFCA